MSRTDHPAAPDKIKAVSASDPDSLRAPALPQTVQGILDPRLCRDGVLVVFGSDAIRKAGDRIDVTWQGQTADGAPVSYVPPPLSASAYDVGVPVYLAPLVPQQQVLALVDGSLTVSYQVTPVDGGAVRHSGATTVAVSDGTPPSPPLSDRIALVAGQRSSFACFDSASDPDDTANTSVRMLTGMVGGQKSDGMPVPQAMQWRYENGDQHQGLHFHDTRPDLALSVSIDGDDTIPPIVLAHNRFGRGGGLLGIVDDASRAWTWEPSAFWAAVNSIADCAAAPCGGESITALPMKDGSLQTFGSDPTLQPTLDSQKNARLLTSTFNGFAILDSDGRVASIGLGEPPPLQAPTRLLATNLQNCYAVDASKSIYTWSATAAATRLSTAGVSATASCVALLPTVAAAAALFDSGDVRAWGQENYGGSAPSGLGNVVALASTAYAYAALRSDGSVVAWGQPKYGGIAPDGLSDVILLVGARSSFAALKRDGTVETWGALPPPAAHLSGVVNLVAANQLFAALHHDGTVSAWGNEIVSSDSAPESWRDVVALQDCGATLLAVTRDGTVHYCTTLAITAVPGDALKPLQGNLTLIKR